MEKLTKAEARAIDDGKCPDCGQPLFITAQGGLALNVACIKGHRFWVAPGDFTPERITPKPAVKSR